MPYFLIGEKELREKPELVAKLAGLVVEDSCEKRTDRKWLVEKLDAESALSLVRERIENPKIREAFLISLDAKGRPEGYMTVDFPPYKRSHVTVRHTFVSARFRRRGVATRLTYRLVGVARSKGYAGLDKALKVPETIKFGEKILANPRKVYRGGKPTGEKAEAVRVESFSNNPKEPFSILEFKFSQRRKRNRPK